ncbi:branched-chain amino acid ABC transporter permease [Microvirga antarctica]|uniref:branched-chain amino acid ABC transporter permease n=1 Tax=Microvirga antarctica TaxID=2819233 RepID=UPI001B312DAC|nr:branched-chain amino acid ABC transporter permease [Microvirga antarctica]
MSSTTLRNWLPATVILMIGAVLPWLLQGNFQLRIAMLTWVFAIFGMGFNLLYGIAGQLSLGQQAFFAIGAYTFALLQIHFALSLPLALLGGIVVCAVVGLVIGLPVLRLRTHYLAMATLMFAMIVHDVALRWTDFTGGTSGLRVPPPSLFGARLERIDLYYLVFGLAAAAYCLQIFIKSTHLGRALEAVKTDETAASSVGIDVTRYKVSIFVVAAMFAAVAGIAYALVSRGVDPSYSGIGMVVNLLTLSVVGGLGSRIGPFIGAAIVIIAPQILAGLQEYQTLIYGVGLLVFMIFLPRGIGGSIERSAEGSFDDPKGEKSARRISRAETP